MATSAHALRVCRLYRSGLKNLMNWTVHRELWIEEGFKLRPLSDHLRRAKSPCLEKRQRFRPMIFSPTLYDHLANSVLG